MIELISTVGLIEQSEKKAVLVNRYWCEKLKRLSCRNVARALEFGL